MSSLSKPMSSSEADILSAKYAQAISARSKMVASWLGDSEDEDEVASPDSLDAKQVFHALPNSSVGLGSRASKQGEKANGFNRGSVFKNGFEHASAAKGKEEEAVNSKQMVQAAKTLNTIKNQLKKSNQKSAARLKHAAVPVRTLSDSESDDEEEVKGALGKRKPGGKSFFDKYKKAKAKR